MLLVNKDLHYCISHAKTGTEANAWGCHCTDMHIKPCPPWLPSHAMAFLSLRTNTERISIKSPAGDQYHRQIKLLHFAWNWNRDKRSRIRQNVRIDVGRCCRDVKQVLATLQNEFTNFRVHDLLDTRTSVRKKHLQWMSDKCSGGGIIWPRTVCSSLVSLKMHSAIWFNCTFSHASFSGCNCMWP